MILESRDRVGGRVDLRPRRAPPCRARRGIVHGDAPFITKFAREAAQLVDVPASFWGLWRGRLAEPRSDSSRDRWRALRRSQGETSLVDAPARARHGPRARARSSSSRDSTPIRADQRARWRRAARPSPPAGRRRVRRSSTLCAAGCLRGRSTRSLRLEDLLEAGSRRDRWRARATGGSRGALLILRALAFDPPIPAKAPPRRSSRLATPCARRCFSAKRSGKKAPAPMDSCSAQVRCAFDDTSRTCR